jgi:hypothetical protein
MNAPQHTRHGRDEHRQQCTCIDDGPGQKRCMEYRCLVRLHVASLGVYRAHGCAIDDASFFHDEGDMRQCLDV